MRILSFLIVLMAIISQPVVAQVRDTTRLRVTPKQSVQLPKNTRITPVTPVTKIPAAGTTKTTKTAATPETIVEGVIYVKANATGANNGTSWSNAFTKLESALSAAVAGKTIWVAAGVYRPGTGLDRTLRYTLKNRVSMYGHFAGNESSLSQRNIKSADSTFLDGDIGRSGYANDNSYTILFAKALDNTTIIDGFVIQQAVSDQGTQIKPGSSGAGIYIEGSATGTNPVFRNCTIKNNKATWGGAVVMYCAGLRGMDNGGADPRFENCNFSGNNASFMGGAVFIDGQYFSFNPGFFNCSFTANKSDNGGAVYHVVRGGSNAPVFEGCRFSNNIAGRGASVSHAYGSTDSRIPSGAANPRYTRCEFYNNQSTAFGEGDIFTAAYNRTYTINISECRFEYIGSSTTPTKFGRRGGAFFNSSLMGGGIVMNINNSVFNKLQCGGDGGVIYNYSRGGTNISTTFTNCLFNENLGCSGGVLWSGSDDDPASSSVTTFNNSIFWYNYFQPVRSEGNCGRGQDFYLSKNNHRAVLNNCLTNKASLDVMAEPSMRASETGMLFMVDPLFTDPASRDFTLRSGSPAKDAGNNSFVTGIARDLAGNSRRSGAQVDIGPFEIP